MSDNSLNQEKGKESNVAEMLIKTGMDAMVMTRLEATDPNRCSPMRAWL